MVLFPAHYRAPTALHDIVAGPVGVCGVGTGFEGVFSAHARWQATASDGEHLHKQITRRAGRGIKRRRSSSRYYKFSKP